MPITTDEQATPFRAQHGLGALTALGRFGGGFVRRDCTCTWEGTAHTTARRADREWESHRDAMRKLSKAQVRALRDARAQERGIVEVNDRTGEVLRRRGLVELITLGIYRITPAGRGVLIEHDRLHGAGA